MDGALMQTNWFAEPHRHFEIANGGVPGARKGQRIPNRQLPARAAAQRAPSLRHGHHAAGQSAQTGNVHAVWFINERLLRVYIKSGFSGPKNNTSHDSVKFLSVVAFRFCLNLLAKSSRVCPFLCSHCPLSTILRAMQVSPNILKQTLLVVFILLIWSFSSLGYMRQR